MHYMGLFPFQEAENQLKPAEGEKRWDSCEWKIRGAPASDTDRPKGSHCQQFIFLPISSSALLFSQLHSAGSLLHMTREMDAGNSTLRPIQLAIHKGRNIPRGPLTDPVLYMCMPLNQSFWPGE